MTTQLPINFCARVENTQESNAILQANKDRINGQVLKVYQLLKEGKRLTVRSAMIEHGIGHLPRRIKDLKEAGYDIKSTLINGHFKEYYLLTD